MWKHVHPEYSAGIRITAFGTWVSSHYHKTKAPALPNDFLANPVWPDWNTFGKS